jgi:hypothetical protein
VIYDEERTCGDEGRTCGDEGRTCGDGGRTFCGEPPPWHGVTLILTLCEVIFFYDEGTLILTLCEGIFFYGVVRTCGTCGTYSLICDSSYHSFRMQLCSLDWLHNQTRRYQTYYTHWVICSWHHADVLSFWESLISSWEIFLNVSF